jgi:hypothetical protein
MVNDVLSRSGDEANRRLAKDALERVCSAAALDESATYYSASFVDHVNDQEYRGLSGVEQSVSGYRKLFDEMVIDVKQQHVSDDCVTSIFEVRGVIRRRRIVINGITISRIHDGRIVEDWSVTDRLGLLRQVGLLGMPLLLLRSLR